MLGPISAGDLVYFIGDSISVPFPSSPNEGGYPWYASPGALVDQINAVWGTAASQPTTVAQATPTSVGGTSSGAFTTSVLAAPPVSRHIVVMGSGQSGATAQQIADNITSTLIPEISTAVRGLTNPVIVILGGINDAFLIHAASETIGQFQTAKALQYSRIYARWPLARIIDCSCFCLGEKVSGGAWGSNPADAEILAVDNAMATLAAANSVQVVDFRAALAAWETVNNPAQDPGGHAVLLEGNNVHSTFRGAIEVMGPAFRSAVTISA